MLEIAVRSCGSVAQYGADVYVNQVLHLRRPYAVDVATLS